VITPPVRDRLAAAAKALYYAERQYPKIVRRASEAAPAIARELDAFTAWLPGGSVDQKHLDALALLEVLRGTPPARAEAPYPFEHTTLWEELRRHAGHVALDGAPRAGASASAVVDELRLASAGWADELRAAIARRLGLEEARRLRLAADDERVFEEAARFCAERDLLDGDRLDAWLSEHQLTPSAFHALMSKQVLLRALGEALAPEVEADLLDEARVSGRYAALVERARRKQPILAEIDASAPAPEAYERAVAWLAARDPRGRVSPEELARRLGFAGVEELRRAALAEYLLHERARGEPA
jgi:hypothetical protein